MQIDSDLLYKLIEAVVHTVDNHWQEFTALDQAIGDGDHGAGMKRGFDAVMANAEKFSQMPLPEALVAIGKTLVMSMGGASGPLYGTFFMELGKSLNAEPDRAVLNAGFARAVAAVAARGKSEFGDKTMLDVLVPVSKALEAGADARGIARVAAESAQATVSMQALRGRAAFLGERSVGHMDPGARSSSLIIGAVCAVLEEQLI
ncbi:dihydroxyacetone kinase subunit DhaL [Brucellaceae bacterium C25G]